MIVESLVPVKINNLVRVATYEFGPDGDYELYKVVREATEQEYREANIQDPDCPEESRVLALENRPGRWWYEVEAIK